MSTTTTPATATASPPSPALPPSLDPLLPPPSLPPTATPTMPPPPKSLLLTTCAMAGISLCYSAQINLGTPHLLHLGLPPPLLSIAWLAGPLSGLIIQPLVGYFSDTCHHPLGRRRPFLICGALLTALSLLLFANSHRLAHLIHPPNHPSSSLLAIAIAVGGFFCMDFCVQAVQAPLRALVTDVFTGPHRHRANALIALFTGVGNLLGGALAGAHWTQWLHGKVDNVDVVFASAAVGLLITTAVSVVSTPERPLGQVRLVGGKKAVRRKELLSGGRALWKILRGVPNPFWQVFLVQLCTWCGFFTLFVYLNTWVATNVFGGDAGGDVKEKALFESGVRFGGIANALMALVTVAYSSVLPGMVRVWGVKPVYAFSQAVEAICLLSAPFIRGNGGEPGWMLKAVVLVDVGMIGVVWATTLGLPWTLAGNALESDEWYAERVGLFTTLFNASQSFPQLVVALIAYPILRIIEDVSAVMFLGGVCSAVGGLFVIVLRIDDARKDAGHAKGLPRLLDTAKLLE